MASADLTAARLRELFYYSIVSGRFYRLVSRGPARAGEVAGTLVQGYLSICVDGRDYKAHRLAFLYLTGEWPTFEVDHVNGQPAENMWINLRDVTHAINRQNMRAESRTALSGFVGVTWHRGKWRASIKKGGKKRQIGRFDTPEEASAAQVAAKRQLHPGCTI